MSLEANKAVVRRWIEANSDGQSVFDEVLDANVVFHFPGSPEPIQGIEGVKQLDAMFHAGFPDMTLTVEDLIAEGDKVTVRWAGQATHTGVFQGIPATGKQVSLAGIDIARLDGGKIVEDWNQFDQLSLMQQLGAA